MLKQVGLFVLMFSAVAAFAQPVSQGTDSGVQLEAPDADESFMFVIFGDRTGGPAAGISVLRDAVEMAGWLDPDFVMTVGDLINGYDRAEPWLVEMREFKGVMSALSMPWYPVAGNHDVYSRPSSLGGHVGLYKEHFGPLYYSFDHKFAHFVVLYTDESLSFSNPSVNQNMSHEQLAWLKADLAANDSERLFVFVHHPRWLEQYKGSNWPEVERVLLDDGRPTTVVGGHIHSIRDDGIRSNIRYMTMGSVGAYRVEELSHSSIDHITLVHARPDRESVVHLPMDSVRPHSDYPGWESDEIIALNRGGWLELTGSPAIGAEPGIESPIAATLTNPTRKPIDVHYEFRMPAGWSGEERAGRVTLDPGETRVVGATLTAPALGDTRPELSLGIRAIYPIGAGGVQMVSLDAPIPVRAQVPAGDHGHTHGGVLRLDGESAVRVELTERPEHFTLEAWVRGEPPKGRTGLICNTESSGFGIFWSEDSDGATLPAVYAHVAGSYASLYATEPWDWSRWTHIAMSFDGTRLRYFVGGKMIAETERAGAITRNALPLFIGADVDRRAKPMSFFTGELDEVRLSRIARYTADFVPEHTPETDEHAVFHFRFDDDLGIVFPDESGNQTHGWSVGSPQVVRGQRDH